DSEGQLVQTDIAEDGEFFATGLPAGRYSVRALTLDGGGSEAAYVTIDDEEEQRITLTVNADRIIRGLLTSESGPVAGATITAMPTDRLVDFFTARQTDGGGRFGFTLPNGSRECDFEIDAPGFALRLYHQRVESAELTLTVSQQGGTLRLRLPEWNGGDGVMHPWLLHDGAVVTAYTIDRRQASLSAVGNTTAEAIVAPGAYTVCFATAEEVPALRAGGRPAGRCTSGVVPPFGALELDVAALAPAVRAAK
ncbi:MAG TPA: carboxypeptidase-like regulatory domain-containing protein, partial [Thermoanaerobaculia bacterium]